MVRTRRPRDGWPPAAGRGPARRSRPRRIRRSLTREMTMSNLSGGDPMIPESVRSLVATGPLAHLTTLNSNGSPQVTVVWIGIEDDEFVSAHLSEHRKVRNVRNDGRVALSFLGKGRNPQGLLEYVVSYGRARVTEGGAVNILARLAQIYIGP